MVRDAHTHTKAPFEDGVPGTHACVGNICCIIGLRQRGLDAKHHRSPWLRYILISYLI